MPAKRITPEGSVKLAVERFCLLHKIPFWRMNAGNIVIPGRGRVRLNDAGTADLLLAPNLPMGISQLPTPVFLWVELKRPDGGKLTMAQLQFADYVRDRGHSHLIVTDVQQLIDWLKEERGS